MRIATCRPYGGWNKAEPHETDPEPTNAQCVSQVAERMMLSQISCDLDWRKNGNTPQNPPEGQEHRRASIKWSQIPDLVSGIKVNGQRPGLISLTGKVQLLDEWNASKNPLEAQVY
jgi:hypothetical protein